MGKRIERQIFGAYAKDSGSLLEHRFALATLPRSFQFRHLHRSQVKVAKVAKHFEFRFLHRFKG
jgi:hypothetical protein